MAIAAHRLEGMLAPLIGTSVTLQNMVLNQTTDQVEWIFSSDTVDAITHLYVRFNAKAGTTPVFIISLQGVTNGVPDGTIKGGGTPASKTFDPTSLGWATGRGFWLALDNSYTPARGEMLAIVIAYSSGTIDASNSATFTYGFPTATAGYAGLPYAITNDNGARTTYAGSAMFGYRTASIRYGKPLRSIASVGAFTSASSPNEYALKMTPLAGYSDTFTVGGIQGMFSLTATGNLTFSLYSGGAVTDTTAAQAVSFDCDNAQAAAQRMVEVMFDEASLTSITYGNSCRLAVAPDTQSVNLTTITVEEVEDFQGWQGGDQFCLSSRAGGNWIDDTLSRPVWYAAHLDTITEAAGGGSAMLIGPGKLIRN